MVEGFTGVDQMYERFCIHKRNWRRSRMKRSREKEERDELALELAGMLGYYDGPCLYKGATLSGI